jgi:exodeoxyribonuclease VII large subunit
VARRRDRLTSASQLLNAFSYRGVLSRGFALVRDANGHPLRAAASVGEGARLEIEFSDGRIGATADGAATASPASKEKPRKGPAGQGTLF